MTILTRFFYVNKSLRQTSAFESNSTLLSNGIAEFYAYLLPGGSLGDRYDASNGKRLCGRDDDRDDLLGLGFGSCLL